MAVTTDERELERLVTENMALVTWTLLRMPAFGGGRWTPGHADADDDVQAGYVGLLQAVRTWDPERSKLSTWACQAVVWAVSRDRSERYGANLRRAVAERERYLAPLSLDGLYGDGVDRSYDDTFPDEGLLPEPTFRRIDADPEDVYDSLTDRERTLVYNIAADAADRLGIKKESARRARARTYDKLRARYVA